MVRFGQLFRQRRIPGRVGVERDVRTVPLFDAHEQVGVRTVAANGFHPRPQHSRDLRQPVFQVPFGWRKRLARAQPGRTQNPLCRHFPRTVNIQVMDARDLRHGQREPRQKKNCPLQTPPACCCASCPMTGSTTVLPWYAITIM